MDSSPAYVLTLATGYVRCLSFTPFAPQSAEVDVTSLRCADETHRWTISQGRLWGSDPTEICTYIYIYNINIYLFSVQFQQNLFGFSSLFLLMKTLGATLGRIIGPRWELGSVDRHDVRAESRTSQRSLVALDTADAGAERLRCGW